MCKFIFFCLHISKIFIIFAPDLEKIVGNFLIKDLHGIFFSCIISARGRRAFINGDVLGFGCLIGAVVLAWLWIGATAGYITLGACVLLSALAVWGFLRSRALDKMALDTKVDGHVELANNKLNNKKEEQK